jgi:Fe-S cluster assembly protein SufD
MLIDAPEGVTDAFNEAAVVARAAGAPEWLRELRLRAWRVYEETPLPTTRLEEWRYTEISQLKLDAVRLADEAGVGGAPPAGALELVREDRAASARVLVVDDELMRLELDHALAERGVILMPLAEAAVVHGELVRRYLGSAVGADFNKFAALNAALWRGGVFVYVPKGVQLAEPVRVGRWLSREGIALFPRTLIVAEEGSHIAYVDQFRSPDLEAPALSCPAVEVIAGQGAEVQYVSLQEFGRGVRHVSMQRTIAGRDSNLDTLVVNLGATVARVDLSARLEGPGARSDMLGLYFGRDDQHFDHNTRQDHVSPHATSDLLYKGALYDASRAVFRGIIRVHPKAQRTDAYQTNRNLLLSDSARADSLPNLEIEADDVRCSHAATVGQLDEEEMFYLMSRGIPRVTAERLVVFGFFGEVLDRLPLPDLVEELRSAIGARIV